MKRFLPILFLAVGLLLALGWLAVSRFSNGRQYPVYSSLRTDPQGAKVLYDSLSMSQNLHVTRIVEKLNPLPESDNVTLLNLGQKAASLKSIDRTALGQWEAKVRRGMRLVVALNSEVPLENTIRNRLSKKGNLSKHPQESNQNTNDYGTNALFQIKAASTNESVFALIEKQWGFQFVAELPISPPLLSSIGKTEIQSALLKGNLPLPQQLQWHPAFSFDSLDPSWHIIYTWKEHPVIIERSFGQGSIVLCASSHLFVNLAMRESRQADLLAWILGSNTDVAFDETHLGVVENPGVATLLHKYHLEQVLIILALLAGLFVWKSAVPFGPGQESSGSDERINPVAGQKTSAGFNNLLKRSIPEKQLLVVCCEEWKKSLPAGKRIHKDKIAQAQALAQQSTARHASSALPSLYRDICRILS